MQIPRVQGACASLLLLLTCGCGHRQANDSANESAPGSGEMSLPCTQIRQHRISYGGPGQPSPEEAVAPFADGLKLVSDGTTNAPRIHGLDTNGTVVRTFEVAKHDDGWWTDGWADCDRLLERFRTSHPLDVRDRERRAGVPGLVGALRTAPSGD